MDKERAIITQVAAKIAADLVDKQLPTEQKVGEFATLFTSVKDIIFEAIEATPNAQLYQFTGTHPESNSTTTSSTSSENWPIQIVGKQHGDLPDWLITACRRDGTTKIYDNRDGLAINPKRPWFKSVEGDKAYWAPKNKSAR